MFVVVFINLFDLIILALEAAYVVRLREDSWRDICSRLLTIELNKPFQERSTLKLTALDQLVRNPLLSTNQLRAMLALRPNVEGNIVMHWDGIQWWQNDPNNELLHRVEQRDFRRRVANEDIVRDGDNPFNFGALRHDRQRNRELERQERRERRLQYEQQQQAQQLQQPPPPRWPQIQQQRVQVAQPGRSRFEPRVVNLDDEVIIVDSDSDGEINVLERRILKKVEEKAELKAWQEFKRKAEQPFVQLEGYDNLRLECAICLDNALVRRPIVLNCGHFFCTSCIYHLCKINRDKDKPQCCPTCRVDIKYSKFPNETFPSLRDD